MQEESMEHGGADGGGEPGKAMGQHMMRERHQRTLWVNFAAMALGLWLASSPWLVAERDLRLSVSNVVSGALIIVFGGLSLSPDRGWARWANCFVGIWLLVAPLVFWAPTAVAYATNSFIGAWIIALSILIPGAGDADDEWTRHTARLVVQPVELIAARARDRS
ncbi:MAG TPA: SPW repeat protein [Thermomicrobiales bacterium]|nr:SPW repeat protein [Thermomicrobiales bacterium]